MIHENEAMAAIRSILEMDDAIFEEGYDDIIKLFDIEDNVEQALMEKIAYCRANNLTIDDLLEENRMAAKEMPDEIFGQISPAKQKFIKYLMSLSTIINNKIIEKGLHQKVNVRVQRLPHNEKLPSYAHTEGDSGLDVFLTSDIIIEGGKSVVAPLGIKVVIPLGYEIQVRPRSGMSLNPAYQNLFVANSPGTIDANYRDEVGVLLKNIGQTPIALTKGMKVAQLVLAPVIQLTWVEVPDVREFPTERMGGFGSTGE